MRAIPVTSSRTSTVFALSLGKRLATVVATSFRCLDPDEEIPFAVAQATNVRFYD
jgi:hypothetical protein